MKRPALPLLLGLLTFAPLVPSAGESTADIFGMDLQTLRGNGVSSVQWTKRTGYYTLQVIYGHASDPRERPAALRELFPVAPAEAAAAAAALPAVQVWVLLPQGRYVEPLNRHQVTRALQASLLAPGQARSGPRMELIYRFALPDGANAEAVAIKVGNDFRIEKLLPLGGKEL